MNRVKLSFLLILSALCLSLSSCDDDEDINSVDCDDATLSAEVDMINARISISSQAFVMDPTNMANCIAFRDDAQALIGFVNEFESCFTESELEQLETSVMSLEQSLAALPC